MRGDQWNLMRFVRGVHRRFVAVRALERAGACGGVASIFACAFASVALMQGRNAMWLVLPMLLGGAILGLIWGLMRRPTRFDAVLEADRQLDLADLLATAYAQRESDDPWQRTIVSIADARCAELSPATVIVHRYGGRAWGGIGLVAALGLTLALLSGVPQDSRARAVLRARVPVVSDANESAPRDLTPVTSSASGDHVPPRAESDVGMAGAAKSDDAAHTATPSNNLAQHRSDQSGTGEKPAQTSSTPSGDAVPRSVASGDGAHADTPSAAGGGASQTAAAAPSGVDVTALSGSTVSGDAATQAKPPPWSSPSWDADRAAAGAAMRDGRVPDAYRDVVSEYFRGGDTGGARGR